jgi:hypothetical protein
MKKYRPSFKKNEYPNSKGGIFIGDTKGLVVPRNNRRACLCKDTNTYKRECCDGYLINEGIGQTITTRGYRGAFSTAFSFDFDRVEKD